MGPRVAKTWLFEEFVDIFELVIDNLARHFSYSSKRRELYHNIVQVFFSR